MVANIAASDLNERMCILKEVPCRDEEATTLLGLLGHTPEDDVPACLFVYGDSGCGKTLLVKKCLVAGMFKYCYTNCVEAYSIGLLYQSILEQLSGHVMIRDDDFQPYAKCSNLLDFVLELRKLSEKFGFGKHEAGSQSLVIVLDRCDHLRQHGHNLLTALAKLRELTELKLCVILISALPWHRFHVNDNTVEPILVYLPQYTQKQVLTILLRDKPAEFTDKFYENFVNLFLSIFYQACRDVCELKYQAKVTFENYVEPITKGELTENDVNVLWKRAQPFFKKSLRCLYVKTDGGLEVNEKLTSVTYQALSLELPFYSKYLLLGAYIASFNPSASDKRLFVKHHGKAKKSTKRKSIASKLHLLGPKPFGLQRLFAIVAAILEDERFNLNADLFVEVASLVRLNLLTQMSEDLLDSPTFKCNVGLPFIDVIAKNVQFPIRKYLVDFMDS